MAQSTANANAQPDASTEDTKPQPKPQPKPRAKRSQPRTGTNAVPAVREDTKPQPTADDSAQPQPVPVPDAAAHAAAVRKSGAELLDEMSTFVKRFWVAPSEAAYVAFVLWAAHTHGMQSFTRTPRLAILGDEPGIGKTRGLDLLALLAHNASIELDPTGPAFAAKMSSGDFTALIDETDTIWGKNGSGSGAMRTLRSILNSGYRRGAKITRKKGREWESILVFGPVAFAGMGTLPATIMDRSIPIRMERRKPHQKIETYMPRTHEALGREIGKSVGDWVRSVAFELANSWPEMPDGISDRKSEVAESILSVADIAGGHWPKDAREALRELLLTTKADPGPSPAERILRDVRSVWPADKPRISSAELCMSLIGLPDAPWSTIWNVMNAGRELASLVGQAGIRPRKVKLGDIALQGYRREDFGMQWAKLDAQDKARDEAAAEAEAERKERAANPRADDSDLDELEDEE